MSNETVGMGRGIEWWRVADGAERRFVCFDVAYVPLPAPRAPAPPASPAARARRPGGRTPRALLRFTQGAGDVLVPTAVGIDGQRLVRVGYDGADGLGAGHADIQSVHGAES